MHLLFYTVDGAAAKAKAADMRKGKDGRKVRAIHSVACTEREPGLSIEFMPCVPDSERARLMALHEMAPLPPGADIPLPPPPNPLGALEIGWKENAQTSELVNLANAVSGRMPENRDQAIAVLTEALNKQAGI